MSIMIGKNDGIVTYENTPDVDRELFPNTGSGGSGGGGGGTGGIPIIVAHGTWDDQDALTLDIKPSDVFDEQDNLIAFPIVLIENDSGFSLNPASSLGVNNQGEYSIYADTPVFAATRNDYFASEGSLEN